MYLKSQFLLIYVTGGSICYKSTVQIEENFLSYIYNIDGVVWIECWTVKKPMQKWNKCNKDEDIFLEICKTKP